MKRTYPVSGGERTDNLSIQHLSSVIAPIAYPALALLLLGCGVGMPLSEDVIVVIGGYLVGRGYTNLWWTLAICYPCVLAGDVLLYEAGRGLARWPRLKRRLRRVFTPPGGASRRGSSRAGAAAVHGHGLLSRAGVERLGRTSTGSSSA